MELLERFQRFTGEFRWQWRSADIYDFLADLRYGQKPISLKSLLSDSNEVAMFCAQLTHPGYGLRRREMTMLDLEDLGQHSQLNEYGRFGAVQTRLAESLRLRTQTTHRLDYADVRLGHGPAQDFDNWRCAAAGPDG
ncbi:hypothetical protein ABIE37_000318 [Arthrobacter bambusae]|uniref:Uncharacterized protein n=1 Tax=Arthrobacter bambusae TaxID=1338426 RepID=A0ABV2P1E2_9MICC